MSFTREQWSRDFLAALGNSNPAQTTVDWVVGWTVHETATDTGALYNLLNTTEHAPGSTTFNSVGVQNFVSYDQGVQVNAHVLGENFPGYPELKQALLSNDAASLDGPSDFVRQGLTTWCGGCGYGVGFAALGASHQGDTFTYGGAPVAIPAGPYVWPVVGKEIPSGTTPNQIATTFGLDWQADLLPINTDWATGYDPTLFIKDGTEVKLPGYSIPSAGPSKADQAVAALKAALAGI